MSLDSFLLAADAEGASYQILFSRKGGLSVVAPAFEKPPRRDQDVRGYVYAESDAFNVVEHRVVQSIWQNYEENRPAATNNRIHEKNSERCVTELQSPNYAVHRGNKHADQNRSSEEHSQKIRVAGKPFPEAAGTLVKVHHADLLQQGGQAEGQRDRAEKSKAGIRTVQPQHLAS